MKVGLIGVGTMGSRMCEAFASNGHEVFVRDIRREAEKQAQILGAASIAQSPAEVAHQVKVVVLSLPQPEDIEEVVAGDDGILTAAHTGLVIVDTSTVDPGTTRRLAAKATAKQIGYVDAPVLGRPQNCGNWTLPCGETDGALDTARPILEAIAERIVAVGDVGSGNVVKLLNNLMFGAINAITAEVMVVCAKVGMSPRVFFDTVAESGAATVSNLFLEIGPKMLVHDWEPKFSIDLLYKDNLLGLSMGQEYGTPMPMSQNVHLLNEIARAKGYGALDTSALVQFYEELLDVSVETE
jgi:3-hydroxyisobutyrate dehydrogenase-like beta-hydroxyacid dehydrogenase